MSGGTLLIVGESLVDLIEEGEAGERAYRPRYGGSPLNVAVGAARLGAPVQFVTAVGADAFGRQIDAFLREEGVEVADEPDPARRTCLALASRVEGHIEYEYFGDPASMVDIRDVPDGLIHGAAVLHAGSTAFLADPALATVTTAFERARTTFKTLDPNPRPALISDLPAYRAGLEAVLALADLVKLSAEDIDILDPGSSVPEAAQKLIERGAGAVIVTAASESALVATGASLDYVSVPRIDAVDPTGAGDSFMASLLADISQSGFPVTHDSWVTYAGRAARAAAFTCGSVGGAASMPTVADLERTILPTVSANR